MRRASFPLAAAAVALSAILVGGSLAGCGGSGATVAPDAGPGGAGHDGGTCGGGGACGGGSGTGAGSGPTGGAGEADAARTTCDTCASEAGASDGGYAWRNVVIGGGGWITGLVRDPTSGDLFARGDVGSLYRFDGDVSTGHWTPLLDAITFPDWNEYGVESVALSPTYATDHTLYIAVGMYNWPEAHDVLKSTDRGATWVASGFSAAPMVANGDGRWCGERMAVDPNDPTVVLLGSPHAVEAGTAAGLFQSTGASAPGSWEKVSSFPATGDSGEGLSFVVFDPAAKQGTRSATIYVGVVDTSGDTGGVWRSTNAGADWTHLPGSSQRSPCRAQLGSDGTLFVDFRAAGGTGTVAKIARGASSLVETQLGAAVPSGAGFYALAVDPTDPRTLYTTQSEGPVAQAGTAPDVLRHVMYSSHDAETWSFLGYQTPPTMAITQQVYTWFAGPAAMVINPSDHDEAWMSDGFGVMHTANLTAATPAWASLVTGIEEIVPDALLSLPTGDIPLLSGASDVGGFIHTSLTAPPTSRLSSDDSTEAIDFDFCRKDPNVVVYTGHRYTQSDAFAPYIGVSSDGGKSFAAAKSTPSGNGDLSGGGRIAIDPTDCAHWVVQPFDGSVWATTDSGASWLQAKNGPSIPSINGTDIHDDVAYERQLTVDDSGGGFYAAQVTADGKGATVFSSADGLTWTTMGSVTFAKADTADHVELHFVLAATPGKARDLWLAVRNVGVFHSSDGGKTITQVPSLTTSGMLAFGAARPGSTTPSLFLHTAVGDFQRSDDLGATWTTIDDPTEAVGDIPNVMEGDRQVWGRVFVATGGRGIFVGAPR